MTRLHHSGWFRSRTHRRCGPIAAAAVLGWSLAAPVAAESGRIVRYTVDDEYEMVRQDLADAIIGQGFVIDYTARIGEMLKRTAADVGAVKPLFAHAEAMQFCSAKLSRQAMEADPANIAFCPYVLFVYELAEEPGRVVVGYRSLDETGSPESRAALGEINRMLDAIAREAAGVE